MLDPSLSLSYFIKPDAQDSILLGLSALLCAASNPALIFSCADPSEILFGPRMSQLVLGKLIVFVLFNTYRQDIPALIQQALYLGRVINGTQPLYVFNCHQCFS